MSEKNRATVDLENRRKGHGMAEFINYMVFNQKRVDWSSIVMSLRASNTIPDNKLLHLACSADDSDKRALSVDIVSKLMHMSREHAVEYVDDLDGKTPVHRACVMAWDDLDNFEPVAEKASNGGGESVKLKESVDGDDILRLAMTEQSRYSTMYEKHISSHPSLYFCEIAEVLLSSCSQLIPRDDKGNTALHIGLRLKNGEEEEGNDPIHDPAQATSSEVKKLPFPLLNLTRLKLVRDLIEHYKSNGGLLLQDRKGNTPLHHSINLSFSDCGITLAGSFPPYSVETILAKAEPNAISIRNDDGMTPLHLLASHVPVSDGSRSKSADAIMSLFANLVQLQPDALLLRDYSRGFTPLHYLCMNYSFTSCLSSILPVTPEKATRVRDHDGCTPLHIAAMTGFSCEFLVALLSHDPSAANEKDDCDATPLLKFYEMNQSWFEIAYKSLQIKQESELGQLTPITKKLCDIVMLFVSAAAYGKVKPPGGTTVPYPIHACASIDCPTPVLQLALLSFAQEAFETDASGELPLHKACVTDHVAFVITKDADSPFSPLNIIQTLLYIDPLAPMFPNKKGQFPLHLAIAGDMDWEGGVGDLVAAAPDIVSLPDPVTKLYPFMLAATKNCDDGIKQSAMRLIENLEELIEVLNKQGEEAERKAELAWKTRDEKERILADEAAVKKWQVLEDNLLNLENAKRIHAHEKINREVSSCDTIYRLLRTMPSLIDGGWRC